MAEPRVDILMATYNGASFLQEQVESIRGQDHRNWRLLVHDDGSRDQTLAILREFVAIDERIVLIEDEQKGLGAARNFLHLLGYADAPYVFFADQDDVWLPSKVSRQLAGFPRHDVPSVQYCNGYYLVDDRIEQRFVNRLHPRKLNEQLFLNGGIVGCSMVMNRAMQRLVLPAPQYVAMHDHLLVTAALTFGELHYVDVPLFYYRQHSHNVTGKQERRLFAHIKGKLLSKRTLVDHRHYEANRSFYAHFKNRLPSSISALFEAYFAIINEKRLFRRLLLVKQHQFQLAHKKYLLYLKTILRKTGKE